MPATSLKQLLCHVNSSYEKDFLRDRATAAIAHVSRLHGDAYDVTSIMSADHDGALDDVIDAFKYLTPVAANGAMQAVQQIKNEATLRNLTSDFTKVKRQNEKVKINATRVEDQTMQAIVAVLDRQDELPPSVDYTDEIASVTHSQNQLSEHVAYIASHLMGKYKATDDAMGLLNKQIGRMQLHQEESAVSSANSKKAIKSGLNAIRSLNEASTPKPAKASTKKVKASESKKPDDAPDDAHGVVHAGLGIHLETFDALRSSNQSNKALNKELSQLNVKLRPSRNLHGRYAASDAGVSMHDTVDHEEKAARFLAQAVATVDKHRAEPADNCTRLVDWVGSVTSEMPVPCQDRTDF